MRREGDDGDFPDRTGYDDDGIEIVRAMVPTSATRAFLIPEDEGGDGPVYDTAIEDALAVVGEAFFFEYALVDRNFRWIVLDTDHNEVLFGQAEGTGSKTP